MRRNAFVALDIEIQAQEIKKNLVEIDKFNKDIARVHDKIIKLIAQLQTAVPMKYSPDEALDYLKNLSQLTAEIVLVRIAYRRSILQFKKAKKTMNNRLINFFDLKSQMKKLDIRLDVKDGVIHLYTFIQGQNVSTDEKHGHYGIDFNQEMVFWRGWGRRHPQKRRTETLSIKNYAILRS